MSPLEQAIQTHFRTLAPADLQTITSFFTPTMLKKSAFLIKAGRLCTTLHFVASGLLRVFASGGEKEITQWIAPKGYFVTDLAAFMFGQPARWSVQALADCEFLTIKKEDYEKLGRLVTGWPAFERGFVVSCFTALEDRIFGHLSLPAEERYRQLFESQPELFNQVPLQYLASMLGMSPETLSRIRSRQLT